MFYKIHIVALQSIYQGFRISDGNLRIRAQKYFTVNTGEIMPHKLNKSEKREQADIAKSIEKHLNSQTGDVKVLPLLMNFIKGETIQPEIDFK